MKNHVRNIQNNDVVNLGDVHHDISAKNYTESGDINIYQQEKELDTKFTDANLSFYEDENEYLAPLFTSEVFLKRKSPNCETNDFPNYNYKKK